VAALSALSGFARAGSDSRAAGAPAGAHPQSSSRKRSPGAQARPRCSLGHPSGIAVDAQHNVYVSNTRSVTIYAPGAYGNVVPARMIARSNTTLFNAKGIAVDGAGNVYVSQRGYHARRSNIASPTCSGSTWEAVTSHVPAGLALDASGNIYLADEYGNFDRGSVLVFGAWENGDVAPRQLIIGAHTALTTVHAIAVR
jgi:hypothetical protein